MFSGVSKEVSLRPRLSPAPEKALSLEIGQREELQTLNSQLRRKLSRLTFDNSRINSMDSAILVKFGILDN